MCSVSLAKCIDCIGAHSTRHFFSANRDLISSYPLPSQILAHGLFLNPHAAIQGLWDVLDWVMVLATLGVLLVYLVECEKQLELWVTVRNLPMWFRLALVPHRSWESFSYGLE